MRSVGKKNITTDEFFRDNLVPLLIAVTQNEQWDEPADVLRSDTVSVDHLGSELFNLKMFFVDLVIHGNTDGSVRDQLRDQLLALIKKINTNAFSNVIARQASYGDAYINCPFPENGPCREYFVVKRFGKFVEADPLDPIVHMALTTCATVFVSSLNKMFQELNDQYLIIESEIGEVNMSVLECEEFFLTKIEQVLGGFTGIDRTILLSDPTKLSEIAGCSPDLVARLNKKGVKALTIAYKQDTAGKNKDAGLVWNQHNESIYKYSERAISGVVQNWYLSEGRPLEKKIFSFFGSPDW